jgi:hypothetical protein
MAAMSLTRKGKTNNLRAYFKVNRILINTLINEAVYLGKDPATVRKALDVQMRKIEKILGIQPPSEPPQT